jgi:hypothetical protein
MMSYLEGDSLLKEIEKSLEDDCDEDGDDILIDENEVDIDRYRLHSHKD